MDNVQQQVEKIQATIGALSFNMIRKKQELRDLQKQYDQLYAQLAVLQNLPAPKPLAPQETEPTFEEVEEPIPPRRRRK